MTKARGETGRRQMGRISILERRMRQLVRTHHKTDSMIAEISAIEWALPILEQYITDKYGELPPRVKWHKHEKNTIKHRLWTRAGDICYLCEQPMRYREATIDHVVPLAKFGKDNMTNYKLVHPLCNIEKGNMTLEQYRDAKEKAATKL